MSEFERSGHLRRSVRRPRAPKPPETQEQSLPVASAVVNNKNNTNSLRRDYSSDQNETTMTTAGNKTNIQHKNTSKTSDGGDSSKFDFNVIQNYINKLEFNVLMNKTTNDGRINRDDVSTNFNKDNNENNFVRGGANRTSVQNHTTTNHTNDSRKIPILRTRSDTERVEHLRKQMLLKSANQNMTLETNSLSKQQVTTGKLKIRITKSNR